MTSPLTERLQRALENLEGLDNYYPEHPVRLAIDDLRAALKESQSPCPHIVSSDEGTSYCGLNGPGLVWSDEPPTEPGLLVIARRKDVHGHFYYESGETYFSAHGDVLCLEGSSLTAFTPGWQWCVLTIADPTPQEPSE